MRAKTMRRLSGPCSPAPPCSALRPWTVLPRRALGPPLSASARIARQRVVCGKVRKACCLIYAAVRGLFALLLLNNFFDTFLPYTDEQLSRRRDVVCAVCVCVWKMEIPISGDFCRLLGSAKSSRQRTEDKAMYRRNSNSNRHRRQQGIPGSKAAKHPSQQTVRSPCIFPLTCDVLRFVRRHQKLNNIYDHCDIFVVVSCP